MNAQPSPWSLRIATERDEAELELLIAGSSRALLAEHYTPEQIEAALGPVFGVDRQLIRDETFYVAEAEGRLVGCGGWSKRDSLFGGDAARDGEDDLLDPTSDPARIRAFFVDPEWTRRGIGSAIMDACETAIRDSGFRDVTIVATLAGEPLYAAFGYEVVERFDIEPAKGIRLGAVRMRKGVEQD